MAQPVNNESNDEITARRLKEGRNAGIFGTIISVFLLWFCFYNAKQNGLVSMKAVIVAPVLFLFCLACSIEPRIYLTTQPGLMQPPIYRTIAITVTVIGSVIGFLLYCGAFAPIK